MRLTRRHLLAAGATAPLAGALSITAGPAAAQAATAPLHREFRVGDWRVTTLLVASRPSDAPQETFGMNVSAEEFAAVSAAAFIPADRTVGFFTPTLVNTGQAVVLFDTGLDPASLTAALGVAGYAPGDVTHVVLTHMHGDHIGGLADAAGGLTFPDAAYACGQVEYDYWAGQGNDGFEAKVRPLADRMVFLADGQAPLPGVTAVASFGHSPGHMGFMLDAGAQQLMVLGDLANHHVWSLAQPDWEVRFDADKPAAAAARRRVLGMAAADRFAVIGYHLPFPAAGFVETRGDGFHFVPVTYQFG